MTATSVRDRWAQRTFGGVKAGDERRARRVVMTAARVAARPAGTVTEVFDDGAEREAAYRLLSNTAVTSSALGEAMFASTAKQCADRGRIFVATDGSTLSLTDEAGARDVGSVGSWEQQGRGMQVLTSLAMAENGVPIGVCAQTWWARTARAPARRNDFRPLDEKESRFLAETVRAAEARMRSEGQTRTVHVLDRGFDVASVLVLPQDHNIDLIVRAAQDRRLATPKGEPRRYLKEFLQGTPIVGRYTIAVPERPGRPARTARVQVQAASVQLLLPITRKHRRTIPFNAVLIRELDGPKGASLHWLLLTTESIASFDDITMVVRGYAYRWRIEEMHRAWKRGGCNVEDMQLRSREAILKWATIHCAVAARAVHLAHRARTEPEVSAAEEFTQLEIEAVLALRKKPTKLRPGEPLSLGTMVRLVADAGGYTGRSSGGPPGPTVIARGLERIAIAAQVLENLRQK